MKGLKKYTTSDEKRKIYGSPYLSTRHSTFTFTKLSWETQDKRVQRLVEANQNGLVPSENMFCLTFAFINIVNCFMNQLGLVSVLGKWYVVFKHN